MSKVQLLEWKMQWKGYKVHFKRIGKESVGAGIKRADYVDIGKSIKRGGQSRAVLIPVLVSTK